MGKVVPKMVRQRSSDAGQSGGGELDAADDVRTRCKKNFPSVLTCISKMIREGCDRGSEVGIVHSGRDDEGLVHLSKPKEFGRTKICEKDFVSN